jgi:uroporphyrinogen decarboxylase
MPLLPLFIEAGYDAINPMEVKAGMDLLAVKRDYGDVLALWGGIDIRVFDSDDPDAIEREIAFKVPVAMKGGGYIFASDHSIPPSASLDQYGKWLKCAYKYGTYK